MEDAFAAIDNGGKLRQPNELPFDICFGGRRQFCDSDYTDLGTSNTQQPRQRKVTEAQRNNDLKTTVLCNGMHFDTLLICEYTKV